MHCAMNALSFVLDDKFLDSSKAECGVWQYFSKFFNLVNPFPNNKFNSSKLKEFADGNFKLDENGREFSKQVENTGGKRRNCLLLAISSFPYSVFKRLV